MEERDFDKELNALAIELAGIDSRLIVKQAEMQSVMKKICDPATYVSRLIQVENLLALADIRFKLRGDKEETMKKMKHLSAEMFERHKGKHSTAV